MAENVIRFARNGNVLYEGHFPADATVEEVEEKDAEGNATGVTIYDVQFKGDDMPGLNTANSELEARLPAEHAHHPYDTVNPPPETLNPVEEVELTPHEPEPVAPATTAFAAAPEPAEEASDKEAAATKRTAAQRRTRASSES